MTAVEEFWEVVCREVFDFFESEGYVPLGIFYLMQDERRVSYLPFDFRHPACRVFFAALLDHLRSVRPKAIVVVQEVAAYADDGSDTREVLVMVLQTKEAAGAAVWAKEGGKYLPYKAAKNLSPKGSPFSSIWEG